jgi:hypothetical protein
MDFLRKFWETVVDYDHEAFVGRKTDGNENLGECNEDGRKEEEEEYDVVSIPAEITTDSSPADLLEKPTNNRWIVHTVGELIYQSVLGGFGDVAASLDPDATASERDSAQGLSTDSAILSADATDEEKKKSILQNVGKIISFSVHTVKEAVLAHIDQDHNELLPDHREDEIHDTKTWNKVPVKANMDIISVVVPSDPGNQQTNGERNDDDQEAEESGEKSIIQSVGEMITHSAQSHQILEV